MRITCPTCSTQYDVDENDIAFTGQDVQCTECMTVWTQARSGEASNPRLADALAEDAEEITSDDEQASEEDALDIEEASPDLDAFDAEDDEDTTELEENGLEREIEETDINVTDLPDVEDASLEEEYEVEEKVDVPLEDASAVITDEEPAEDTQDDGIVEAEELEKDEDAEDDALEDETVVPESQDDDDDENPIWKEIAALAQEARADSESESASESTYSPPDDMPPIQSSPVVPDEVEPAFDAPEEEDRPWEVTTETNENFSDFVWNDPSKNDVDEADIDDTTADHDEDETRNQDEPDFTPPTDASSGSLESMDDDLIAAALNEQMAIEDALEDAPKPAGRDISDVPVELGGPRTRIPNVEALKSSVRSKSVKLTADELQEQVPARRFRRGFSLILLTFVVLGAVYISRSTITEYVPAVGPYLETYATFVDLFRAKAEVLGAYVWDLMMQGYDWVIAKFFS